MTVKHIEREATQRGDRELLLTLCAFILLLLPLVLLPSIALMKIPGAMSMARERIAQLTLRQPAKVLAELPPRPVVLARTQRIGYSEPVRSAMRVMGLSVDAIDRWISSDPSSALRTLKYMSKEMQQNVASTAIYIRKSNPRIDAKTAWREAAALIHYSGKYGVPSALATAVAHAESTFDPNAVSKKGASGVMQVMWRLHDTLLTQNGIVSSGGRNPLADPEQAIAAGCLLLSRYLRAYGSLTDAMERYYGGRSASYQRKIDKNIAKILDHHAELYQ